MSAKLYPLPSERIKVPRFEEANGFYTTPQRSKQMSKIRAKDTKPEVLFRKQLWARGTRYRLYNKQLPGRPDIVLRKYKTVVFIDGEFWHGYNWETRRETIKSNREFWIAKIERNMQRDREVNAQLEEMGWTVFRFWSKDVTKNLKQVLWDVLLHLEHVRTTENCPTTTGSGLGKPE